MLSVLGKHNVACRVRIVGVLSSKPQSQNFIRNASGSGSDPSADKGRPAIHHPKSAAEKDDPEVKKHNEEMKKRSDQTVNQLSEKDNKVDKKYWTGTNTSGKTDDN